MTSALSTLKFLSFLHKGALGEPRPQFVPWSYEKVMIIIQVYKGSLKQI